MIDRCRLVSRSEYLISAGIRKNRPNGSIHPDSLTKKFVAARKFTGINLVITHRHFTRSAAYPDDYIKMLTGRVCSETPGTYFREHHETLSR
ncbi:hypothetical protein SEEE2651_09759 [Salmonella enterica subsp. enterica serovar Enteritidis str. 76-2651]|nr:hypothetical protein SEEE2651_09759 [Salmonella enterica subsp. enterica serovar Enteritidis str. 76-2651]